MGSLPLPLLTPEPEPPAPAATTPSDAPPVKFPLAAQSIRAAVLLRLTGHGWGVPRGVAALATMSIRLASG
jgi:hypothetical protein